MSNFEENIMTKFDKILKFEKLKKDDRGAAFGGVNLKEKQKQHQEQLGDYNSNKEKINN